MSHLLLYLYPLTVSINSNMLTIKSFLSSFPLYLYLAISAASSGVSSLHSWFIHNGLVLNPTKTEAICFGNSPRLPIACQSNFHRGCWYICFTGRLRLLGVIFDRHLNFYKHISNVCSSSYFYIRTLCHIRPTLDSETFKTIACTIVDFRLDHVNAILTGISSRNFHRLQHVQNSLV